MTREAKAEMQIDDGPTAAGSTEALIIVFAAAARFGGKGWWRGGSECACLERKWTIPAPRRKPSRHSSFHRLHAPFSSLVMGGPRSDPCRFPFSSYPGNLPVVRPSSRFPVWSHHWLDMPASKWTVGKRLSTRKAHEKSSERELAISVHSCVKPCLHYTVHEVEYGYKTQS